MSDEKEYKHTLLKALLICDKEIEELKTHDKVQDYINLIIRKEIFESWQHELENKGEE